MVKKGETMTQEMLVYEHIAQTQGVITAKKIMDSLGLPRAITDKYLCKFKSEGKILRLKKGEYLNCSEPNGEYLSIKMVAKYLLIIPIGIWYIFVITSLTRIINITEQGISRYLKNRK